MLWPVANVKLYKIAAGRDPDKDPVASLIWFDDSGGVENFGSVTACINNWSRWDKLDVDIWYSIQGDPDTLKTV